MADGTGLPRLTPIMARPINARILDFVGAPGTPKRAALADKFATGEEYLEALGEDALMTRAEKVLALDEIETLGKRIADVVRAHQACEFGVREPRYGGWEAFLPAILDMVCEGLEAGADGYLRACVAHELIEVA